MRDLMEEMQEKEDSPLDNNELQNKLEVLKELHEMATELLSDDMDSYKEEEEEGEEEEAPDMEDMMEMGDIEEISVVADDEEGLEEGLDAAQDLLKKKSKLSKRPY